MNVCIECQSHIEAGIRRGDWQTFCNETCLTKWDTRQAKGQALFEKLKAATHGQRFAVRTRDTGVCFTIIIVRKYGLRGYTVRDATGKVRKGYHGMLLDNATLLDWCTYLEEL